MVQSRFEMWRPSFSRATQAACGLRSLLERIERNARAPRVRPAHPAPAPAEPLESGPQEAVPPAQILQAPAMPDIDDLLAEPPPAAGRTALALARRGRDQRAGAAAGISRARDRRSQARTVDHPPPCGGRVRGEQLAKHASVLILCVACASHASKPAPERVETENAPAGSVSALPGTPAPRSCVIDVPPESEISAELRESAPELAFEPPCQPFPGIDLDAAYRRLPEVSWEATERFSRADEPADERLTHLMNDLWQARRGFAAQWACSGWCEEPQPAAYRKHLARHEAHANEFLDRYVTRTAAAIERDCGSALAKRVLDIWQKARAHGAVCSYYGAPAGVRDRLALLRDIPFDRKSATLNSSSRDTLIAIRDVLRDNCLLAFDLIGHAYPWEPSGLGLRRARAVEARLIGLGVARNRLRIWAASELGTSASAVPSVELRFAAMYP